jgi:hypothetical protein
MSFPIIRIREEGARQDEQGLVALAVALSVCAVLFLSGLLVFQVASFNQADSSLRRIQAQSLYAAEGGLDRAYQALQSAATSAQLPCGPLTENFATGPAQSSYSASISYFDTFPPTDAALACTSGHGPPATVVAAEVISTGRAAPNTAQNTAQYMEALIKITPGSVSGSVFDKALFSNQTMAGSNNGTIYGQSGNDANVYTNGNVNCGNGFSDQGSVTAEGTFTGTNNCTVNGNVTAVGNVILSDNSTIGGNVTSTGNSGCPQQGNITMSNFAVVDQSAYAYCSISLNNNASIAHSKVANDTTLVNPTAETFPVVPMPTITSQTWTNAGYTNQITDNTCTAAGVYADILNMATASAPTLIETSCALSWSGNTTISLNQNLAVFSTGGFTMSNNTTWQSTNATTRQLYLIVPSVVGSTQTTCTSGQPGITFQNNTTFATSVQVLDYTPCTISIGNNSTGYGQVYGGQVAASNNFTAHYVPMTLPGATGGGQSVSSTTIAVVYERQLSSLAAA